MITILLFIAFQRPVEKLLSETVKISHIIRIHQTFDTPSKDYIFQYVPNINPLNPLKINRFSSKFGTRFHPIDKYQKAHHGLDISAPEKVPVHVAAKGVVIFTGFSHGYGNYIIVEHKYGFVTKYAHLSEILTMVKHKVNKGDIIGRVGSTGKSTGSHLHYEIIKNNSPIDPYPLVNY